MSNIKVQCIDQAIGFLNTPVITSGDVNYDTITFDFCSKWDGFAKTAIFYRTKDEVYYQILDESDSCLIPREVLTDKGTMYIGVFGSKDDVTITSAVLAYKIQEGAITENTKPSDPTPDIYDQIIAKYADYNTKLDSQIERMDELEARLNTGIGDAEKLGGELPEYYATAQSVEDLEEVTENIINGTTEVAKAKNAETSETANDALKLDGKEASDYMLVVAVDAQTNTLASLINFVPLSGKARFIYPSGVPSDFPTNLGTPTTSGLLSVEINRVGSLAYYNINAVKGNGTPFNITGYYTGVFYWNNNADGGNADTVDGYHASDFVRADGSVPMSGDLTLNNGGTTTTKLINYNGTTVLRNRFDTNNYDDVQIKSDRELYFTKVVDGIVSEEVMFHSGNSSPVVPVNVDPGVGASVTYADGTILFYYEEAE